MRRIFGTVLRKINMDEVTSLQGRWKILTLEVEGNELPASSFPGAAFLIEKQNFTAIGMGADYEGTLSLDTGHSPKRFDILFRTGPHAGLASLGIYELNGDVWKICLGFAGRDRPLRFQTSQGSGHALETLSRQTY
jgi:uncharacterized protein (TIGR03067 family)